MSRARIQAFAHKSFYSTKVEVLLRQELGNGTVAYANPLTFTTTLVDRDEALDAEPTFSMRVDEAQGLLDALWQAGIRPTHGDTSPGALGATERHLADLRTLLFHTMEVKDGPAR